jgi:Type IV secretion system proteins
MRSIRSIAFLAGLLAATAPAVAQVPVIDSATLSQATQTASNTASIMQTNQQIMQTVQETLKAVTGNRQTGSIASAALGSGFNMSGAPSLSSILGGGQMAWGNLGEFGQVAAGIINGLKLVNTLTGLSGSSSTGTDKAYQGAVNTATALQGMVAGTQSAASSRTNAFQAAGGMIGTAQDIKGSIDQNSQLQVQTGLTVNELIGVMNAANAALNAQQMQELAGQAHAAKVLSFDSSSVRLVAP